MGRRPAPRILVIDQSPARAVDQLRERLTAVDAQAEWRRGSGQKFLLTVPHKASLPEESLTAIVDWVTAAPAGVDDVAAAPPVLAATPFVERAVRFGAGERIFGIVVPAVRTAPSRASGHRPPPRGRGEPHRSPPSLRDPGPPVGGDGLHRPPGRPVGDRDTPARGGDPENLVYPRDGLSDIGAAIDFILGETGARRVILAGLCSGADFTFQVARRGAALAGAIMMNPRTFLELNLARVEGPPDAAPEADSASRTESLRVTAGFQQISSKAWTRF